MARSGAQHALASLLRNRLQQASDLPVSFSAALGDAVDKAVALAERVAVDGAETLARLAATALYNATSAVLLAWEATRPGVDGRRALLARFVMAYRPAPKNPLAPGEAAWEEPATGWLLGERAATLADIASLLT